MSPHRRLPVSARHAFALAFDLAVRRDAVQSLWVPLLLHTPWLLAGALLPIPRQPEDYTLGFTLLSSGVLIGETVTWLTISGMLRFRAKSVFNTPAGVRPEAIGSCYARGFRRIGWLYVSEFLRYAMIFVGFVSLFFPGVWLAFRFSMVTEAVVLRERSTFRAMAYSFRVTDGRLERWLEMIVGSVGLLMGVPFLCVIGFLFTPASSWNTWVSVAFFLSLPMMTIVQYAWTFFFLRLEEIDPASTGERPGAPVSLGTVVGGGSSDPGPRADLKLVERPDPGSEPLR